MQRYSYKLIYIIFSHITKCNTKIHISNKFIYVSISKKKFISDYYLIIFNNHYLITYVYINTIINIKKNLYLNLFICSLILKLEYEDTKVNMNFH